MDDGLILIGLLLTMLSVPIAIVIAHAAARRWRELSGARLGLQLGFCFSILLGLVWLLRMSLSTRSEDYGALAALLLGVITVPICFLGTLVAAILTVRHVQRKDDL